MSRWLVVSGAETALRLKAPHRGSLRIGSGLDCDIRCVELGVEAVHAEVFLEEPLRIRACAPEVEIIDAVTGDRERTLAPGTSDTWASHERARIGPLELTLTFGVPRSETSRLWDRSQLEARIRAYPSGIVVRVEGDPTAFERAQPFLKPEDVVGRLGPDAFGVFLRDGRPSDAANLLAGLGGPAAAGAGVAVVDAMSWDGALESARPQPSRTGTTWTPSEDPVMGSFEKQLDLAASSAGPILVLGETGTGKDLVVAELQRRSVRRFGPLIRLSAIELDHHGIPDATLHRAGGGFIVIDEVSALSCRAQLALTRQLEGTLPGDPRLIATSNQTLERLVSEGRFRNDLFFRLAWVRLDILPLRKRPADVQALTCRILATLGVLEPPNPAILEALGRHLWPGNVRELEAVLAQAVRSSDGRSLGVEDLPIVHSGDGQPTPGVDDLEETIESREPMTLRDEMAALERRRISQALERNPNQTEAAKALGIPLRTFLNRMDALGIPRARKR